MFNSKNASLSTYKSSVFDKISINVFSTIHKLNLSPLVLLICQYLCKLVSASKHTVVLRKNLHYVISVRDRPCLHRCGMFNLSCLRIKLWSKI